MLVERTTSDETTGLPAVTGRLNGRQGRARPATRGKLVKRPMQLAAEALATAREAAIDEGDGFLMFLLDTALLHVHERNRRPDVSSGLDS